MQTIILKQARKYIETCDKITRLRLEKAIADLPEGDVKKMQCENNEYRLRVGDLRVLFTKDENGIVIRRIMSRGQVYKRIKEDILYGSNGINEE